MQDAYDPRFRELLFEVAKERGLELQQGVYSVLSGPSYETPAEVQMFAGLGAAMTADPGPPSATDALAAATVNGARTARLEAEIGAIAPGMKADLTIVDLTDVSFVPFNSAARQLVFTESGRAVETVIVDGRVVLFERRSETIDEAALRQVVEESMIVLRKDLDVVQARTEVMNEYLLEAWRRVWAEDIGVERYVGGAGG